MAAPNQFKYANGQTFGRGSGGAASQSTHVNKPQRLGNKHPTGKSIKINVIFTEQCVKKTTVIGH